MFEILTVDQLIARLNKYNHKELHIHHTWSPRKTGYTGTDASALALQKGMSDFHINTMHWSCIGQHVTLLPDGRFVTGRDFGMTPASILGYNTGAFAVEMLGDFDSGNEVLEGPQKAAIAKLTKYFDDKKRYTRFHRENSTKTCPGTGVNKDAFMAAARGQVVVPNAPSAVVVNGGNALVRELQELINEAGIATLKVDGIWGPNTQNAVPDLMKGITKYKWIIRLVQKRLIALGYALPKFGPDGDYGSETANAIAAYQKAKGLTADGIAGDKTIKSLLGV